METLKFLIVGDANVGKTCLIIMYTNNYFPEDYIPTVTTNYNIMFSYLERPYRMELWDTAGQEEYAFLRPLSYVHTQVFFVCFSVVDPTSHFNVKQKWIPEVRHHCPHALIILVGTKQDLREDKDTISHLKSINQSPITYDQGQKLANEVKAYAYCECSALKNIGLKELFQSGVTAYFLTRKRSQKPRMCRLL